MEAKYVDHMGSDLRVVNAARVSFNKESTLDSDGNLKSSDVNLIKFLARGMSSNEYQSIIEKAKNTDDVEVLKECFIAMDTDKHWTPFAHCMVTMREEVPIFVARQRFKHVIGFTYNETSRRYSTEEPKFFKPSTWREAASNVKQGSSEIEHDMLAEVMEHLGAMPYTINMQQWAEENERSAVELYNLMIKNEVCAEQARMVLPQNMYTSYYVTGSLAAWARAYKQRINPHAQKEIQDLAKQWDAMISPLFPVSWKALTSIHNME